MPCIDHCDLTVHIIRLFLRNGANMSDGVKVVFLLAKKQGSSDANILRRTNVEQILRRYTTAGNVLKTTAVANNRYYHFYSILRE